MKKRLLALLLLVSLLLPAALASAETYYFVNTSSLKVRELPESGATVLSSYRRDWAATIEDTFGDFSYVRFTNGQDGYVMTKYLKSSKSYTAYVNSNNCKVRHGPGGNFEVISTLSRGTKVTVLSHGKNFDYISSEYGVGYVKNTFLGTKYVAPTTSAAPVVSESAADPYTAWVINPNNRKVNLRKGPSKKYAVIAEYNPGTEVTVIHNTGTWCQIKVNGTSGYMMSAYLSTTKPENVTTPTPAKPISGASTKTPDVPYTATVTSPDGKSVNVHRGAGMGYSNVCRVTVGTQVTVTKIVNSSWVKIEFDGKSGYILKKFLK